MIPVQMQMTDVISLTECLLAGSVLKIREIKITEQRGRFASGSRRQRLGVRDLDVACHNHVARADAAVARAQGADGRIVNRLVWNCLPPVAILYMAKT